MDRTVHVVKTKALISCAVTAQLICVFVFAYAKACFLMTRLILSSVEVGEYPPFEKEGLHILVIVLVPG